jgi:hypothetical protein
MATNHDSPSSRGRITGWRAFFALSGLVLIVRLLTGLGSDKAPEFRSNPTLAASVPTQIRAAKTPTNTVTPRRTPTTTVSASKENCDRVSYPTLCIPPPPAKIDCGYVNPRNWKFPVYPPDSQNLDRDGDGIGCEPMSTAPAPQPQPPAPQPQPGNCDPNYSPCIPGNRDYDCPELRALGLAPVIVIGADWQRLDRDRDGYGCE